MIRQPADRSVKVNTKVYSKIDPELRETGRYVLKLWKKFNGNHPLERKSRRQALASSSDESSQEEVG